MNYTFQKHLPNLDALRALSAIYVFVVHYYNYIGFQTVSSGPVSKWMYEHFYNKGSLGVNLFFVLSGFLITYLLLMEEDKHGAISVPKFYLRRVLRIWPLYFAVVVFGYVLYPLVSHSFSMETIKSHIVYHLFFISNLDRVISGFTGIGCDLLGILWSVGVEEQFYLVWPLMFFFIPKRLLVYILPLLIIFSIGFRGYYIERTPIVYLHTFSVMSDLLIGCLVAFLFVRMEQFRNFITHMPRLWIVSMYLLFITYLLLSKEWVAILPALTYLERMLFALFFIFIILEQSFSLHSLFKAGRIKVLEQIGKVSYGFYALHLISIMVLQKVFVAMSIPYAPGVVPFYSGFIIALLLTVVISQLSYKLLEKPFLNLKEKFSGVR